MLAACVGAPLLPVLLHFHSPVGFEPGEASPAVAALAELRRSFPRFALGMSSPVLIMLRTTSDADTVLTDAVANFSARIGAAAQADPRVSPLAPVLIGYWAGADALGGFHVPKLLRQAAFISHDKRATLLVFIPTQAPTMAVFHHGGHNKTVYAPWLYRKMFMEFLKEFPAPAGTELLLTGNPVVAYERVFDRSIEHLTHAEVFVLPLALLIFVWLVGDLRLLLLPPCALVVSFLTAVALAVPLARLSPPSPDVPTAMVSLILALSLDYSLFMLTRFCENRSRGLPLEQNVEVLVRQTGHTILISGLLIAIAFFGATAVPEQNLKSAGLILGVSTLACMAVNVALLPSLLLLAGGVLAGPRGAGCCGRGEEADDSGDLSDAGGGEPWCLPSKSSRELSDDGSSQSHGGGALALGRAAWGAAGWLRLMRCIERRPVLAVAAVFAFFLPFTAQLPHLRATADLYAVLPRDMPSVTALRSIERQFPVGRFDPYAVVLTAGPGFERAGPAAAGPQGRLLGSPLLTPAGFAAMLQLCDALRRAGGVESMLGPPMVLTQRVDWAKAQLWNSSNASGNVHDMYMAVLRSHVNGSSVLLQVHTSFLPRGPGAAEWVLRTRGVLAAWQRLHPGVTASLSGAATLAADARDTAMGSMPLYLGVSSGAIMAVVFSMFRSLMLSVRLAAALLFTLAATFGVAVVVYETTLLHGIWPWLAAYSGVTYEVVPLTAALAVALGLDYDIFLVSRIVEYRQQGLSDRESIVRGVASTGGIISGAGTIMALAFSGLFFAEKLLLQQLALLLVTSVLLDAFVVRTVLVPALMLSAGSWNWWPRRMPEPACRGRASAASDSELEASVEEASAESSATEESSGCE